MSREMGNPAPIGLMAFALSIFMLGALNAGLVSPKFKELVTSFGFWWAGGGQVATGLLELLHGNSFGALVFWTYGSLWMALSTVWFYTRQNEINVFNAVELHGLDVPEFGFVGAHHYTDGESLMLGLFAIATAFFFVVSLRKNRALQTCLLLLFFTFVLLCFGEHVDICKKLGGWGCMLTGCSAFYILVAEIVNDEWGYDVLPGLKPCVKAKGAADFTGAFLYDPLDNTVFLNLSGFHILSSADVLKFAEVLDAKFSELKQKAHVVVNYKGAEIAPAVQQEYQTVVEGLQEKYYLTVKRFAATAFRESEPVHASGSWRETTAATACKESVAREATVRSQTNVSV